MPIKIGFLIPTEFRIAGFYTPEELALKVSSDKGATGAIHEIRKQLENNDTVYDLDIIEVMRRVNSHALAVLAAVDSKAPITDIHFRVIPAAQLRKELHQTSKDLYEIAGAVEAKMATDEGSIRWALKAKEPVIGLRRDWLSNCVANLRKHALLIVAPKKK